ncbi:MAG: heme-binding protein [Clostridia bacterium]|nr:heme-binding protein [Clostridia bacterium]
MNEAEIRKIVQDTISSMKRDKSAMTLSLADELADAVLEEAGRMGVKAVVCVSDAAGNPKAVKVMDDAFLASYDVATGKAYTVVALKMSTIDLKPLAQPGASLYGIQFTNSGRIVIFGGGDPLVGDNGSIIGGLGVSGGTEEQDTALSAYGKEYFETKM